MADLFTLKVFARNLLRGNRRRNRLKDCNGQLFRYVCNFRNRGLLLIKKSHKKARKTTKIIKVKNNTQQILKVAQLKLNKIYTKRKIIF